MKPLQKPILTTVNRKVSYRKYLAFTKTTNCSKCHMTKAARKGLAETSSKMVQNRPKLTFSQGLGQVPPKGLYLDRANRQVVRFKGQNGQNEAIPRSRMRSKSGQNDQNMGLRGSEQVLQPKGSLYGV